MTGYGRAEGQSAGIKVVCEIRSLNGRYLDIDLKLPRFLYEVDPEIRRILTQVLERGSVTVIYNIEFTDETSQTEVKVNDNLAKAYLQKLSSLSAEMNVEFRDPFAQILRLPDIIGASEKSITEEAKMFILSVTREAAGKLMEFRRQEGAALGEKLSQAAAEIRTQVAVVESEEENRRTMLRDRINGSVAEHIRDNLADSSRLEQEILLYLEKWDIAEEKHRLIQHLDYFEQCLKKEPLGRKLNFIAQEMGREMNTMGVKSNHFPMQQAVVLMKEKLEQIKEQVLNLV